MDISPRFVVVRLRSNLLLLACPLQDCSHLPQECHPGRSALHQNASAVEMVDFPSHQIEFGEAVERARNGGLGDV